MSRLTRLQDTDSYQTRDGSKIRELMHPAQHGNQQQSLAEAVILVGQKTRVHHHKQSEELYHITHGTGCMTLGEEQFAVQPGDTICIPPGMAHCIENTGSEALHILCMCAPPYSHDDTVIMSDEE
ncbi:MAG: cupin domain-containing protein [Proteobacteria bacterium]|jgi:mannose-6-phosphate isomerase-like protein (cupin superfamily)|nr:cupin domain-containing protein [Pseudomonadota bacterium]MCG6934546.1 cupin domain-containing protein [Pseudomonadota bacterium]